jgi:hypothetical protein
MAPRNTYPELVIARLIIVAVFARVGPDAGLEEGANATKVSRCCG